MIFKRVVDSLNKPSSFSSTVSLTEGSLLKEEEREDAVGVFLGGIRVTFDREIVSL